VSRQPHDLSRDQGSSPAELRARVERPPGYAPRVPPSGPAFRSAKGRRPPRERCLCSAERRPHATSSISGPRPSGGATFHLLATPTSTRSAERLFEPLSSTDSGCTRSSAAAAAELRLSGAREEALLGVDKRAAIDECFDEHVDFAEAPRDAALTRQTRRRLYTHAVNEHTQSHLSDAPAG
jgi:hypothetical protein